jgi:hypothetical protein
MVLHLIAEPVVVGEELLIVAAETLPQAAHQRVTAGVVLPEILNRLLVHHVRTEPDDIDCSLDAA